MVPLGCGCGYVVDNGPPAAACMASCEVRLVRRIDPSRLTLLFAFEPDALTCALAAVDEVVAPSGVSSVTCSSR